MAQNGGLRTIGIAAPPAADGATAVGGLTHNLGTAGLDPPVPCSLCVIYSSVEWL